LAYHLATAGFEVKRVSSVALARTRQALHNSWDKNDPKDVQVILQTMEIGNEQFYHDPLVCGTNDIQQLSKTHNIVSKSKTELRHRVLTHYLPQYVPEADRFHRSARSDGFFAFLERYPSAHLISAMRKDAFTADAWVVVGRKVAKERLLANIYEFRSSGSMGASPMLLPVTSTARTSSVSSSMPMCILRQTRRLEPPCLRAFHSSSLMPVLSIRRFSGPVDP
jgi:hypothetical protein